MQEKQNWQCPYCGERQVLSEHGNLKFDNVAFNIVDESKYKSIALQVKSIFCQNQQCKELTLTVCLKNKSYEADGQPFLKKPSLEELITGNQAIKEWRLLPDSMAKPQPEYIPESIRKDYEEACKIVHLSPKASAVLSRRCLQSMIRKFCKIQENTLYDEINKLKNKLTNNQAPQGVTEETIEAIDSIRKIGNIGAHMKEKTGILIDIEPKEATLLIELIEMLFKDWYIARHERQKKLKKIRKIIMQKEQSTNDKYEKRT